MTSIVHIISDTNIGGGGRSLLNYLASCNRQHYSPAVILPCGSNLISPIEALDVPIYQIDGMADRSFAPAALRPLVALLRQLKPQLVHTHGSLIGRVAARVAGKKVVYTKHCAFPPTGLLASPPGRLVHCGMEYLLSDGVLAVGHSARDVLRATGVPDAHIHVMYNGVAPLPRPTAEGRQQCRSRYGFDDSHFVVGILARVEVYKGHRTLLQAVEQLHRQGYPIRLLVAGEGDFLPQLREEAQSLSDVVHFAGFVSQVDEVLAAMDIQVNASYESETSSLSLLEGMSMGLPAVVSDCGGNPHLITDGKNGLVFPAQDVEGLAHCLSQLMDSPETLAQMACCATAIFEERFTAQVYAKNIEAVYTDVLNRKF